MWESFPKQLAKQLTIEGLTKEPNIWKTYQKHGIRSRPLPSSRNENFVTAVENSYKPAAESLFNLPQNFSQCFSPQCELTIK